MKYSIKIIKIYINKIKEKMRLLIWNFWQKLNEKHLYTYDLIKDRTRCELCGRNVHDYAVPNEIWNKLCKKESVYCYDCFCDLSDKKKINWRGKYE
jgi:hypothetical protein